MRRTSALKKRIDALLEDITSLRNIILSLCRAYNLPNDPDLMRLIEQTLCQGKWSCLGELAQTVEQHTISLQSQASTSGNQTHTLSFTDSQRSQPGPTYIEPYTTLAPNTAQSFPPAIAPSHWPPLDVRNGTAAVTTGVGQMSFYAEPCVYRPLSYPSVNNNAFQ
jgi:hypothetical protein